VSDSEFTDLLKPHYDDAVNYCRALSSGSSKAEAEDVMQQALLKAYENIDSLRDKGSFKSWFFTIITRCFYNSVRKPFWSRFVSLTSEEGKVAFQVFEDEFFEDNQILIAALSRISKKERVAILLFEIGGFSIEEITRIQNEKSESSIKSRLSRARKKLKVFMEDLENEERVSTQKVHSINQKSKDLYHETTKIINEIKSIG
jgi:RNA polymerase sigma-70 factor (ECF subfamily)